MEPSQCLNYLIEKTKKLSDFNDSQRKIILEDLQYFLKQSVSEPERRHHPEAILNKWKEFEKKVLRTPLLQEPKGFFTVLYDFVGNAQAHFENDKELAHFNRWELKNLFEDLLREFENREVFFENDEKLIVYCGLKFLLSESRLPNSKQDRSGVLKTWRALRPSLEKYGFFYKYQGAQGLSSKLRLFVTGSL